MRVGREAISGTADWRVKAGFPRGTTSTLPTSGDPVTRPLDGRQRSGRRGRFFPTGIVMELELKLERGLDTAHLGGRSPSLQSPAGHVTFAFRTNCATSTCQLYFALVRGLVSRSR